MSKLSENSPLIVALHSLADNIRLFIELSLHEPDDAWEKWLPVALKVQRTKCWEKKGCEKKSCPAYLNPDNRCWLIAGTMCNGKVQGEFALKYTSCTECNFYQQEVFKDPVAEVYEHLVTLIHSLKSTQDKLRRMAIRDLLTGVYNRNYFNETITREIEKAKRYGDRLSIVMIDVDNFKLINDTCGHLHGDGILRECASLLNTSIRSADLLCRYGGDEFLIVLPGMDCRESDVMIRRIHDSVAAWNEEYGTADFQLSLSIGCAVWEDGRSLLEVINEADKLMYENKRHKKSN